MFHVEQFRPDFFRALMIMRLNLNNNDNETQSQQGGAGVKKFLSPSLSIYKHRLKKKCYS
jgi:hypothetical protein